MVFAIQKPKFKNGRLCAYFSGVLNRRRGLRLLVVPHNHGVRHVPVRRLASSDVVSGGCQRFLNLCCNLFRLPVGFKSGPAQSNVVFGRLREVDLVAPPVRPQVHGIGHLSTRAVVAGRGKVSVDGLAVDVGCDIRANAKKPLFACDFNKVRPLGYKAGAGNRAV